MSNFDRAVEVLNKHWSVARASGEADETRCCVRHLEEAGLLAPDTPEPDNTDYGQPSWTGVFNYKTGEEWAEMPGEVSVYAGAVEICGDDTYCHSPEEARALAYALLAAADYAEQEGKK